MNYSELTKMGTSLVVQWLRLCTSNAGGMGLTPGRGTRILHAMLHGQKKKKKLTKMKARKCLSSFISI